MAFRISPGSACALGTFLLILTCRDAVAAETFVFHHEDVLGTSMELRLAADSDEHARRTEERVLREIDRLSAIFSSYDPDSAFSRWLAGPRTPVRIAPELFEVLQLCDRWRTASGGAFEPRVEPLMRLWNRCAGEDRTPTPEEIAGARAVMNRPAWRLDPTARTAERLSEIPVTLNAIAKGYIVERACAAAMDEGGIRGALLNVGGDLRVVGALDRTIGIADPQSDSETSEPIAYLAVRDKAVSTSGRSQRGFRIKGRWYSHKLDPRSGAPVERVACATVIADRSADADALATIFNVLAPEESVRLARSIPGVECLVISVDGRITRSDGWGQYERPRPAPLAMAQEPAGRKAEDKKEAVDRPWGETYELLVKLEINRPNTAKRRYQRPYLAVWVEDKNGSAVRTLTLWVQANRHGSRWIPDLKHWYRSDQARRRVEDTDLVATIARPTRAPASTTSSGTARTTAASQLRPASIPCTSRPRANTGPIRASSRPSGSTTAPSSRNSRVTSKSRRRRSNTGGRRSPARRTIVRSRTYGKRMTSMNDSGPSSVDPSASTPTEGAAGARGAFASAWHSDRRPRIESYLDEVTEKERPTLLGDLLAMELALRVAGGEEFSKEDYERRFPGDLGLIDSVFGDAATPNRLTPGSEAGGDDPPGTRRPDRRVRPDRIEDDRAPGDHRHRCRDRRPGIGFSRHAVHSRLRDPRRARSRRHGRRLLRP